MSVSYKSVIGSKFVGDVYSKQIEILTDNPDAFNVKNEAI